MSAVHVNDQKIRFNNMRRGERESISDFKARYDTQIKVNLSVGIIEEDETLIAIDFSVNLIKGGIHQC